MVQSRDSFDDIFEFESNIINHLTPEMRQRVQREEALKKIETPDGIWLSTDQSRAEFRAMSDRERLYAAFAGLAGVNMSALDELASVCGKS